MSAGRESGVEPAGAGRRSRAVAVALVLLLALAAGAVPLTLASRGLPDLELATRPAQCRPGPLVGSCGEPVVQGFVGPSEGLERVEVRVARMGEGPEELELALRDGERVLRTATARPAPEPGTPFSRASFAFEPVDGSAGRALELVLSAPDGAVSAWAPLLRARRMPTESGDRGFVRFPGETFEGELEALWDDLSAVGIAVVELPRGPARFELFAGEAEEPVRVCERELGPQQGGSALFAFDPFPRSRSISGLNVLRWRATFPPGTVLAGSALGPALDHYHGPRREDEVLRAATGVGWGLGEADVVFRTYAAGRDALALLAERMGWRLPLAAVLWLGAVAVGAATLRRAR